MKKKIFSNEQLGVFYKWLKVINEPNRLLLLEKIIQGVQCNCQLGDDLQIAPNLISHHISILREAGLVEAERDPVDGRWVYYSINTKAMEELRSLFGDFFDPYRVQPRQLTCGPQSTEAQKLSLIRMTR